MGDNKKDTGELRALVDTEALGRMDWQHLVIGQLDRIETKLNLHDAKLYEIHGEVAGLKVRASIFGVLGGLIVAVLARFGMHT